MATLTFPITFGTEFTHVLQQQLASTVAGLKAQTNAMIYGYFDVEGLMHIWRDEFQQIEEALDGLC